MTELPVNQIVCGDVVEVMRGFPDGSIHAMVTDPPYGLEFMGKGWDTPNKLKRFGVKGTEGEQDLKVKKNFEILPRFFKQDLKIYQEWTTSWATEAFRVLKPGASMFVMGGTRTHHRMICGVEDAGFMIKDCLLWCYNSGFPKSQDLSKLIDNEYFEEQLKKRAPEYQSVKESIFSETVDKRIARKKWNKWREKRKKELGLVRKVVGKKKLWGHNAGTGAGSFSKNKYEGQTGVIRFEDIQEPFTPDAKRWDGWKVGGLKPSYEPIVWAVKPPKGSCIDNVLKHGVGAINVDGCRIPYEDENDIKITEMKNRHADFGSSARNNKIYGQDNRLRSEQGNYDASRGRFPPNMIRTDEFHDGYDRFYFVPKAARSERDEGLDGTPEQVRQTLGNYQHPSEGRSVSKSSGKALRNIHPTVKPIVLMEHLIKLVSREGQVILDPFVGSGTTCIAARRLLRDYIGIDNNPEYVEIARRRLAAIPQKLETFAPDQH